MCYCGSYDSNYVTIGGGIDPAFDGLLNVTPVDPVTAALNNESALTYLS